MLEKTFRCKVCNKELREKAYTAATVARQMCPACYTKETMKSLLREGRISCKSCQHRTLTYEIEMIYWCPKQHCYNRLNDLCPDYEEGEIASSLTTPLLESIRQAVLILLKEEKQYWKHSVDFWDTLDNKLSTINSLIEQLQGEEPCGEK